MKLFDAVHVCCLLPQRRTKTASYGIVGAGTEGYSKTDSNADFKSYYFL